MVCSEPIPRTARGAPGRHVDHVLSRAVARMRPFRGDEDFEPFRRVMIEAHRRHPLRILAYCILSNHWHFVVWPRADGQLSRQATMPVLHSLVGADPCDALGGGTPDVNRRGDTGSLYCSRPGLDLTTHRTGRPCAIACRIQPTAALRNAGSAGSVNRAGGWPVDSV